MISDLFIQATKSSPEITLLANGRISISGRCIPREPDDFFAPVRNGPLPTVWSRQKRQS
ncbi:MAG: hypothetical protein WAW07_00570 [Bacteroidales bacterium]